MLYTTAKFEKSLTSFLCKILHEILESPHEAVRTYDTVVVVVRGNHVARVSGHVNYLMVENKFIYIINSLFSTTPDTKLFSLH